MKEVLSKQLKQVERYGGIPPDEWLDNCRVRNSKKKHLELLGLYGIESSGKMLILDAGCGPGTYGIILSEQKKVNVVGIDISKAAIRKAHNRGKTGRFFAVEGDLESLPFKDATFDIVFVGWTLHHFPQLQTVCKELYRVLKYDGKLAVVEPNENNIAMQISRFMENILRPLILKIGWDTPNRTLYSYRDYLRIFQRTGFKDFKYFSCYEVLPPILNSCNPAIRIILYLFYYLRVLLFSLTINVLSSPLNGPDLLITGIKK